VLAGLFAALPLSGRWFPRGEAWIRQAGPWLIVSGLILTVWQLASAKFGWLPLPFFPPPPRRSRLPGRSAAESGNSQYRPRLLQCPVPLAPSACSSRPFMAGSGRLGASSRRNSRQNARNK
jgi:hypothetical protein